jgi:hypothetical protein
MRAERTQRCQRMGGSESGERDIPESLAATKSAGRKGQDRGRIDKRSAVRVCRHSSLPFSGGFMLLPSSLQRCSSVQAQRITRDS